MNSSKLLRAGVPALGLCVFALVQSGCQSQVLGNRESVPPAEREIIQKEDAANKNLNENSLKPFDADKKINTDSAKSQTDDNNFKYPRFEDTDHTPIYSAPKSSKKSAAANSGSSSVYIVKRGDTLGKIAARHRIKTADLAKANNLQLNSIIRVNQKLTIPGGKSASASTSAKHAASATAPASNSGVRSGLYTVRRGDSVYIIAKRLKVKRADLMEVNNLTPNSVLRPGQTLKVPGAKVINEESVIVDSNTADAAANVPEQSPAKTVKKSKEDAGDEELLRNLESDVSKNTAAKTEDNAAETISDAVKTSESAKPAAAIGGTPTEVYQEIHIDDYCKQYKINKADMLKLNHSLNENSILKPNTVFIIP